MARRSLIMEVRTREKWTALGRRGGALIQGMALGILLAIALLELIAITSGAAVFIYQGY